MTAISSDDLVRVGILTIGNEVLDGLVLDTNANWLDNQIASIGLQVVRHATVRDTLEEIGHGIDFLRNHCDVIISSGGLGPTFDDMTLDAVSRYIGVKLAEHPDAIAIIERQYKMLHDRGIVQSPDLTESRRKMAQLPVGGVPLDNRVGGAPGVRLKIDGSTTLICLPGVPSELKDIFDGSVRKWLHECTSMKYYERVVDFPQRDESVMAPFVSEVMELSPSVYIKSMPHSYGTTYTLRVWISARGVDESKLAYDVRNALDLLEKRSGLKSTDVDIGR